MAEKRAFYRSWKFYLLSCILLTIGVAGFFFWRNYKYKIVDKKIDKLVTVGSKGLYELNYKNLVINEALGNISAENVEMLPDSLVYQSMIEKNTAPDNLFYIKIPKLFITGVKTPKALLKKEISAHIIRIENAEIVIRQIKVDSGKGPGFSRYLGSEMYRQLLGKLNSITADSIVLENASLTLTGKNPKIIHGKTSGLSIRFAGTVIDSAVQHDSSRILFSKNLVIHCNQIDIPLKSKFYTFRLSGLDFNLQNSHLHTDKIHLMPTLSETAFSKSFKFAKDRIDMEIGSLDLWHINRNAILHDQLVADTLQISTAIFHIFRDKSIPHDSVDRTRSYPQDAIMQLSLQIDLKKILVTDSYIEYKEKNDMSDSSGKVSFFHVQAAFDNVTNIRSRIKQNDLMRLDFKASFLNEANFTAVIKMKLNDLNGKFQLDATLGELNAVLLNPLLKPMALAKLDRGKIKSLHYNLNATNTTGIGKLTILYEDLSIKLLKKDDEKNKYKTKVLPTLAAGILLKDSNPKNGRTRIGNVDYTRDIHRSIFNLMWKSMFACIKQVAL